MSSFDTVLIANRGAIACRVIRSLKALGLKSVAVYSEADADSAHVAQADVAVCIGPAPAAQSYLDTEAILAAARQTGAGAIHPGYGFLSENPGFAEACEAAGIAFIGPTPAQMRAFGLKHTARELAVAHGVPLLPGSGLLADVAEAEREAQRIGYPVMLKSTAGGGGIGMRLIRSAAEMAPAFAAVARLARANFKDAGLFLEKFVERARHIEVQLFGDGRGEVVALGERDCSAQRRNQKVVEETPAPHLSAETRVAADRLCPAPGPSRELPLGRHGGVRARRRHRRLLLPRGQHAAAGRARRDRAGDRHRPGGVDGAARAWRCVRAAGARAARRVDPGAPLCRRPGAAVPALRGPADRGGVPGRCAHRDLGRPRQRGAAALRPDDRQADRHRPRPRRRGGPAAAGAGRHAAGRHRDQSALFAGAGERRHVSSRAGWSRAALGELAYAPQALEVLEPGVQTSVQDWPGRTAPLGRGRAAQRPDGRPQSPPGQPPGGQCECGARAGDHPRRPHAARPCRHGGGTGRCGVERRRWSWPMAR